MKKLTLIVVLCLLAACDRNRSGAEDAVRDILKDPESARFGEFYFNSSTNKGCLTVNARNSMGGYTGNQTAYVENGESGWRALFISQLTVQDCRKIHADKVK